MTHLKDFRESSADQCRAVVRDWGEMLRQGGVISGRDSKRLLAAEAVRRETQQ